MWKKINKSIKKRTTLVIRINILLYILVGHQYACYSRHMQAKQKRNRWWSTKIDRPTASHIEAMMKRRWQKAKYARAQGRMWRCAWHAEKFQQIFIHIGKNFDEFSKSHMCIWLAERKIEKRNSLNVFMAYAFKSIVDDFTAPKQTSTVYRIEQTSKTCSPKHSIENMRKCIDSRYQHKICHQLLITILIIGDIQLCVKSFGKYWKCLVSVCLNFSIRQYRTNSRYHAQYRDESTKCGCCAPCIVFPENLWFVATFPSFVSIRKLCWYGLCAISFPDRWKKQLQNLWPLVNGCARTSN